MKVEEIRGRVTNQREERCAYSLPQIVRLAVFIASAKVRAIAHEREHEFYRPLVNGLRKSDRCGGPIPKVDHEKVTALRSEQRFVGLPNHFKRVTSALSRQ